MIGLSINENLKLEKGKEKSSSAARSYVRSSSHVIATCHYITAIYRNLTVVYQCYNITPPLKKPALRLYMSVLCLQGVPIFIFFQQLILFAILVLYLLIQVLQGSQFTRVIAIELLKLIETTNKVLYRVLGRIQVIAFPTNAVLQRFLYQFIAQYFFNFLFAITINLNQQGRFILLSRQQVIYSLPSFSSLL